ncbi:hypothetical protein V502_02758 [Pseudogymnoascus sp. VKM F-4520 (FW-2644)]|nr:hypothetical protein V502_02758 [Pseudogymnoascus sp. VKM F-4520 (FW-2644)]
MKNHNKKSRSQWQSATGQPTLEIAKYHGRRLKYHLSAVDDSAGIRAQQDSEKWKREGAVGECSSFSGDDDLTPPRFKRLNLKIRKIVQKRYLQAATQVDGIKWALYKKEQCESLTTELLELIDQLEKAVDPESKLEELSQKESQDIGDSLKTLLKVIGQCDARLEAAATQTLEDQTALSGISVSATTNNGLQMGINRGEIKGITFGANNTITHTWNKGG